jgi:hypothetical protein
MAMAERDLERLEAPIAAARLRLDELYRRQRELRAEAGRQPRAPGGPPVAAGTMRMVGTVAGVPVEVEAAGGDLVITVGRFDPAARQLGIDPRAGTATLGVAVADENGDTSRLGQRTCFDLYPDPAVTSGTPGQEARP